MKQALSFQTFLLMNNLAQNTDPLPGCQQMLVFVNIYIYNTIKLYLCGIHFAYLRTGVQCLLIDHDKFRCTDYYVECVKCIQVQVGDQKAQLIVKS